MTRYARAGKGTHQRVAKDPTPWNDMKPPPPERLRGSKDNGGKRKPFNNKFKKERFSRRGPPQQEENANFTPLGNRDQKGENGTGPGGSKNVRGYGQSKSIKVFGQFWVPIEDGKRLKDLVTKLQAQGLSRKEIGEALKNDRRKAEKAAKRQRDKTCFQCRQFGHVLSDCPNLKNSMSRPGSGNDEDGNEITSEICFKCGSLEHTSRHCRKKGEVFSFAKCFICSGTGHIARQCPKNSNGIYPSGGSCGECGSINHLKSACPDFTGVGRNSTGDDDQNDMTLPMADPFSSTEYEPVSQITNDTVNDKEEDDQAETVSNSNNTHQNKAIPSKAKMSNNKKGNNKRNGKRKMDTELDSATFEFGLSSGPAKPALPPAKRKIVKF